MFEFCSCENEVITCVRRGYWPSTPVSVKICVSIQLLLTLRSLVLNAGVSVSGYLASLKFREETLFDPVSNIFTSSKPTKHTLI